MDKKKKLAIKITIFFLVVAAFAVSMLFTKQIEAFINPSPKLGDPESVVVKETDIQIHFVAVGQADCTVIELPDNKILMIDTGTSSSFPSLRNYLNTNVFDNPIYDNTIHYLILTHTDADHVGGGLGVLTTYNIETVYRPNETVPSTSQTWTNTAQAIEQYAKTIIYTSKNTPSITYDDPKGVIKDYDFSFYGPIKTSYSDNNDYSPVMIFTIGTKTFMFTGDASSEIEQEVLNYYADKAFMDIDVLKVGHHGSKYSSCNEFLQATTPKFAIISCGAGNSYGHPHEDALNRLMGIGAKILRTDTQGSILAFITDNGELNFDAKGVKYRAEFYENADYYIEWWYCGLTIVVAVGSALFIRKGSGRKYKRTDR